jgi:Holliday junction resolvase RusA-like endonuclease
MIGPAGSNATELGNDAAVRDPGERSAQRCNTPATTRASRAYKFTVPCTPVPKARPRVVNGRAYTPARTKAHERAVWLAAVRAGVRPTLEPVTVWLEFHMPAPQRADADNLAKTVLDALNLQAYRDDKQVYELNIRKHRCASGTARTEVCIYPCPEVAE